MTPKTLLDIPTSTQWIQFSTNLGPAANIEWTENNFQQRNAVYYVFKCYWGPLVSPKLDQVDPKGVNVSSDQKSSSDKETTSTQGKTGAGGQLASTSKVKSPMRVIQDAEITIKGETKLFIASEYIDPEMQGGPMKNHHIRDLAHLTPDGGNAWIALQLNEHVHYGQNGSGKDMKRWLVYHPPIAPTFGAPRIFQHRFTGLTSTELALAGVDHATQFAPPEYQQVAEVMGKLAGIGINAMKSAIGHYLHAFLSPDELTAADALFKKLLPKFKDPDSGFWLLAIQVIEAQRIAVTNKSDDKSTIDRITRETQYRLALKAMLTQKTGFWASLFKKGSKRKNDASLAAGLNTCYDGDADLQLWAKASAADYFDAEYDDINEGVAIQLTFQPRAYRAMLDLPTKPERRKSVHFTPRELEGPLPNPGIKGVLGNNIGSGRSI